jgi:hypothetical protein
VATPLFGVRPKRAVNKRPTRHVEWKRISIYVWFAGSTSAN